MHWLSSPIIVTRTLFDFHDARFYILPRNLTIYFRMYLIYFFNIVQIIMKTAVINQPTAMAINY